MRFLVFLLLVTGCASGNCRSQKMPESPTQPSTPVNTAEADLVWVFKYDGSQQCGMGKAVSPEVMKKDLGKIQVYASEKKSDGMMRTQVCGSPTGTANRYQIKRQDLEEAQKAGFRLWIFE